MNLLERASHLRHLETLLGEAAAERGRLVLLGGEAGVGKTALVAEFCRQSARTARILEGACDALSTPRPLGPLADIAIAVGGELERQLGTDGRRERVFTALLGELARTPQPTLIVIEDVHWADEATLDLLRFLGRRLPATRTMAIATYRDDEVGPSHPLRIAMGDLASSAVARLTLSPLSPTSVATLAQGSDVDPVALHRRTGGNPLFVAEVLANGGSGIPPTVRDAVLARVARLSAAGRAVLEHAAVLGPRVTATLLTEVAVAEPAAVDECLGLGLLYADGDGLAFRHELSRQAVLEAVSPLRRLALHRRVLEVLRARPISPDDLAIMAHHAELAADHEAVLVFASGAARRAASLLAHREAAAQFARALRAADRLPVDERAALFEGRSYECYLTDQLEEAIAAREAALGCWRSIGDRPKESENLRWLSRLEWFAGRRGEADVAARAAHELLEGMPPGPELAWAYSNQAQLHMLASHHAMAIEVGLKAAALADQLGMAEARVHALSNVAVARAGLGDERGWAELDACLRDALAGGFEDHVGRAYACLVPMAVTEYRLELAERYFEEATAYCVEHDLDSYRLYVLGWYAVLLMRRGRWDDAVRVAEQLLARPQVSAISRIQALIALGCVRARRGESGADDVLDEALRVALETAELQRLGPVRAARAEAAWLAGDHARAVAEAHAGYELALRHDYYAITADLARWLLRCGGLVAVPTAGLGPFAAHVAEGWAAAAERWQALGCPYEAALALLEGDEAALRRALVTFEELGARPLIAFVGRRLRDLGAAGIPRGPRSETRANPAGLTRREVEVLRLVAAGRTSREIAEALFLSPRTVEMHVANSLGKLGSRSRAEAVRRAGELKLLES